MQRRKSYLVTRRPFITAKITKTPNFDKALADITRKVERRIVNAKHLRREEVDVNEDPKN